MLRTSHSGIPPGDRRASFATRFPLHSLYSRVVRSPSQALRRHPFSSTAASHCVKLLASATKLFFLHSGGWCRGRGAHLLRQGCPKRECAEEMNLDPLGAVGQDEVSVHDSLYRRGRKTVLPSGRLARTPTLFTHMTGSNIAGTLESPQRRRPVWMYSKLLKS